MKSWSERVQGAAALLLLTVGGGAFAAPSTDAAMAPTERWREVPMPPGFQVVVSEIEGPVFADAEGRTLYEWPYRKHRVGYTGEPLGTPLCYDDVVTVTGGYSSPYPAGLVLPDGESRDSCTDRYPPVYADANAEPVGDWTIVERRDGTLQWAYEEQPLYTSVLDREPGDVLGGRDVIRPPHPFPPGFDVRTTTIGRMLGTEGGEAVYAHEQDTAEATACTGACLDEFEPILAPALARAKGEWSILERAPGQRQWVFRGKPLYIRPTDQRSWSQEGSDAPGWKNVLTQPAPAFPESFTTRTTIAGEVLADPDGMTIYVYNCREDSSDQLLCDHPTHTQVYRMALCGAGDWTRCLEYWPYVEAGEDETSPNRSWTIVHVDPRTGRYAQPGDEGAMRVWAYRDRPVYLFGRDEHPGDVHGGGNGEWRGRENGLYAFWVRNEFFRRTTQ